ncbi:class I SAM-dependent methyltransferase [Kitasatospora acidiphila]|uniref:Class I SAM-dependent methyltransferase n=1 Tax=Kitasatospora acidiphila TaxID=2567942 RepID=A0A540WAN0_9ACTN|nr:class I SAM-dependent methyltransferase [Kitasatospora acidiphila]TQF06090.1 class I SAM-dependent methyltransferase [Kitasatospora acidiphila]
MTTLRANISEYWDAAAPSFDQEPDHGLGSAETRAAWAARLTDWLPATPGEVLDAGCGTGSLALLAAAAGHRVTGVDCAPAMVARARAKFAAAGLSGTFLIGDAAEPPTGDAKFDVVLARHLLWTLPDPAAALRSWAERLRPGGRLVLVEGRWRQSADPKPYVPGAGELPWAGGVGAAQLGASVAELGLPVRVVDLSGDDVLWGRAVDDERYALIAG